MNTAFGCLFECFRGSGRARVWTALLLLVAWLATLGEMPTSAAPASCSDALNHIAPFCPGSERLNVVARVPFAVLAGDVDGDGGVDLVTFHKDITSNGGGLLSGFFQVRHNQCAGDYFAPLTAATQPNVDTWGIRKDDLAAKIADLNSDGWPDIVTLRNESTNGTRTSHGLLQ